MKLSTCLLGILLIVAFVLCAGCTQTPATPQQTPAPVVVKTVQIVGFDNDYAPFSYLDENGEAAGLDIDLINLIAKDQGFNVSFVPMNRNEFTDAAVSGKVDLIAAAFSKNEERAKTFAFSDVYFVTNKAIAVKAGSNVKTADIMNGAAVIGVQDAGTSKDWVMKELVDTGKMNASNVKTYSTLGEALTELQTTKNLDAVIGDYFSVMRGVNGRNLAVLDTLQTGEEYVIAAAPSNAALIQKVNAGLANVKAGSDWDLILKKYGLDTKLVSV